MTKHIILARCVSILLVAVSCDAVASENRLTPLVRAVSAVRPAVANIHTRKLAERPDSLFASAKPRKVSGMGTGIIIDERGYIVTNHHVVDQVDESSLRVTLHDGSTYQAQVISYDRARDLAIIKIPATNPLAVMPLGTSSDVMLGETVFAVGNAFGYEDSVTCGIVSALNRDVEVNETQSYEDLIQTDASINPGNSGGPLVNLDGEVVGINVAIRAGAQRIGFAIPIDAARVTIARLLDVQRLSHTTHGLQSHDMKSADGLHLVVDSTDKGTPAAASGFEPGDVVLKVADTTVVDGADFERALLGRPAGESVEIEIERDGQPQTLSLTLAARTPVHNVSTASAGGTTTASSSDRDRAWTLLGLRLGPISQAERSLVSPNYNGAMRVTGVRPGSPAAAGRMRTGDLLLGLHEWETTETDDVTWVLNFIESGRARSIEFFIYRSDRGVMVGRLPVRR